MQVSFVCSEHSIKSRSAEDRLNRQNAGSPSLGTRGKFRAVAMVARSLGQLSVQNAPSSSESSVRQPGMKFRNLGKSGLRVSCLGLGTWVTFGGQITDEMAEQLMTLAYDNGINLFDTAEVYAAGKAEVVLGNIIKKKGWRRSSLVITTKIFWGGKAETERGLSRKHIIEGLKASLERLQLEYVDVVFANRPDPNTPMEETVRAMTHVINQGMAMYWGTSRWSSMEIMEAYSVARQFNLIPPICEQAEYHMFQREKVEVQLPELFHKIGVGAMTWSPLACGIVSGKYDGGIPPVLPCVAEGIPVAEGQDPERGGPAAAGEAEGAAGHRRAPGLHPAPARHRLVPAQRGRQLCLAGRLQRRPADGEHRRHPGAPEAVVLHRPRDRQHPGQQTLQQEGLPLL
ncbi:unnamed protein product, partial [Bubo scandiacus]